MLFLGPPQSALSLWTRAPTKGSPSRPFQAVRGRVRAPAPRQDESWRPMPAWRPGSVDRRWALAGAMHAETMVWMLRSCVISRAKGEKKGKKKKGKAGSRPGTGLVCIRYMAAPACQPRGRPTSCPYPVPGDARAGRVNVGSRAASAILSPDGASRRRPSLLHARGPREHDAAQHVHVSRQEARARLLHHAAHRPRPHQAPGLQGL